PRPRDLHACAPRAGQASWSTAGRCPSRFSPTHGRSESPRLSNRLAVFNQGFWASKRSCLEEPSPTLPPSGAPPVAWRRSSIRILESLAEVIFPSLGEDRCPDRAPQEVLVLRVHCVKVDHVGDGQPLV